MGIICGPIVENRARKDLSEGELAVSEIEELNKLGILSIEVRFKNSTGENDLVDSGVKKPEKLGE